MTLCNMLVNLALSFNFHNNLFKNCIQLNLIDFAYFYFLLSFLRLDCLTYPECKQRFATEFNESECKEEYSKPHASYAHAGPAKNSDKFIRQTFSRP